MAATGVAAASTMSLASCGSGGPGGDDEVTLKLVAAEYGAQGKPNSSKHYWDKLARAFEKKNPGIKIDVQTYLWDHVDAKVAEMVKQGEAPDLAQIGAYAVYAARDQLYSADQLLTISAQANFVPAIAQPGEYRRVQYGLPFVSSSRLLFYNKDLFEQAGLDPDEAPGSWAEIKAAAKALKAAGVKIPYGLPLGREEPQAEALLWMLGNGGGYTDKVGSYTIDSDQNVATFDWIRKNLTGAGLTNNAPGETNRREIAKAFNEGKAGMIFGHPTFMREAREKGIELGISKRLPGRSGPMEATMGVVDWMMAFKQNGRRKEIGTFLDFVFEDDNVLEFTSQYDLLPTTTSAVQKMNSLPRHTELKPFLDQLQSAEFYPAGKTSWAAVNQAVKENIGKAADPGGDPEQVLGKIQNEAQKASSME
ncbi:extracellular solute-binding protein [Streptomyces boninensis]|uniref:extracellular solute-binding protein n=1 Tax=Streptomyces boninensis TaxID=2039455 RepID=UPI003B2143CB